MQNRTESVDLQPNRAESQSVTYSNFKISHEPPLPQTSVDSNLFLSCPCLVFIRTNRGQSPPSNSRICLVSIRSPNFPDRSVRCLDSVRIFCPDYTCLVSVSILSAVRSLSGFQKKAVRCLSVQTQKDDTRLAGLSLSLSAHVWLILR